MELRDQFRKTETEVIEPPKAKKAKKEGLMDSETLYNQAIETINMFDPEPIEDSKPLTPHPQSVPTSTVNHFDVPKPFETVPRPTNSPVSEIDDIWKNVSPAEDAAIAEFLNSAAAEVDNILEHNSKYLNFFYSFNDEVLLVYN